MSCCGELRMCLHARDEAKIDFRRCFEGFECCWVQPLDSGFGGTGKLTWSIQCSSLNKWIQLFLPQGATENFRNYKVVLVCCNVNMSHHFRTAWNKRPSRSVVWRVAYVLMLSSSLLLVVLRICYKAYNIDELVLKACRLQINVSAVLLLRTTCLWARSSIRELPTKYVSNSNLIVFRTCWRLEYLKLVYYKQMCNLEDPWSWHEGYYGVAFSKKYGQEVSSVVI